MKSLKFVIKSCSLLSMCSCFPFDGGSSSGKSKDSKGDIEKDIKELHEARFLIRTTLFEDGNDEYYKNLCETHKCIVLQRILEILQKKVYCDGYWESGCKAFNIDDPTLDFHNRNETEKKSIILKIKKFFDEERGEEGIIRFLEKYTNAYLAERLEMYNKEK